jgi:hypothetical protein
LLEATLDMAVFDRDIAAVDGARLLETATTAFGVRRAKTALSSGCKPHPATAPAGSNRSSHGGNEVAGRTSWI